MPATAPGKQLIVINKVIKMSANLTLKGQKKAKTSWAYPIRGMRRRSVSTDNGAKRFDYEVSIDKKILWA